MSATTFVPAPREGVNDDTVRIAQWLVEDCSRVAAGQLVAVVETTKAAVDVVAPCEGFLFQIAGIGAEILIGEPLAAISESPDRPADAGRTDLAPKASSVGGTVVTAKARPLMERHRLTIADFPNLKVVRVADVERLVAGKGESMPAMQARRFRDELLDPSANWDDLLARHDVKELLSVLDVLRRRMKARFDRHVPTGSLLHDRWLLARDHGFGEGSSVYDECLILGDVSVGRHCWIGPFTVLDGQGGLTIGDHVDIGAGAHVYSHNTIERALTGHRAPLHRMPTRIGSCCFVAPHAIIGPGTVLGDRCFVAAGSYVEGVFPDGSFVAGNPARLVGQVAIQGDRAHLLRTGNPSITPVNS